MAQRIFQQFVNTLEKQTVRLLAKVTATGTQTGGSAQTITRGKGILSVTAAATGQWTVNLADPYFALLGVDIIGSKESAGTLAAAGAYVLSIANFGTANLPSVTLQLVATSTGAATAPSANDVYYIELVLSNSSAL
jgi:hypothetical protein